MVGVPPVQQILCADAKEEFSPDEGKTQICAEGMKINVIPGTTDVIAETAGIFGAQGHYAMRLPEEAQINIVIHPGIDRTAIQIIEREQIAVCHTGGYLPVAITETDIAPRSEADIGDKGGSGIFLPEITAERYFRIEVQTSCKPP